MTNASALTAPPLLASMSTGPAPSARITAWMSSACVSGSFVTPPSFRLLRPKPRGSYVTTVRSSNSFTWAWNPLASIGWPIITSGGRLSVVGNGPWTS
ncbi:hypothetical protein IWX78_003279 [Mycetocola sp. CAN_C7]